MHDELNNQNKALLLRVRELVDAGDAKENWIRELEAQVQNKAGNPDSNYYSDTFALRLVVAEQLTYLPITFVEAVPKEDFNKLKSNLSELKKKYDALAAEKTKLEEENKQKSKDLESASTTHKELEEKIATLESDLDSATKDSEILDKELLSK